MKANDAFERGVPYLVVPGRMCVAPLCMHIDVCNAAGCKVRPAAVVGAGSEPKDQK